MSEVVMRLIATSSPRDALGNEAPLGAWLLSYDPEGHDGRGDAEFTRDLAEALTFPDAAAAFEFYRAVPQARPLRADGKPNRPLTACSVEILTVEQARALIMANYEPPKTVPKGHKRCAAEGCRYLAIGDYCVRHQEPARG